MSWPASDALKAALKKSHTPTMKLEILEAGLVVASTDILTMAEEIVVLDGSVDDDRQTCIGRRTADWTIVDRKGVMAPLRTSAHTYPMKDRDVRLYRGIGSELIPLATVQLTTLQVEDDLAGRTYSMSGSDRSSVLAGADWRAPFTVTEGQTPRSATLAILTAVDPSYAYSLVDSPATKTLPKMTFLPGEDPCPWEVIQVIWQSCGFEVFFDQMGQLKAQPIPDPLTAPVSWSYLDDSDSIRVAPLNVGIDRESLRNGVIVKGSAPWLTYGVHGEAWDTNPTSSTYYDPALPASSPVGPHPEYIEDTFVSSDAEATALATAKLPDLLGIEEKVDFLAIPNPALEAGDVVMIKNGVTGDPSRFILDRVKTPLTYEGLQTANTRRRTR